MNCPDFAGTGIMLTGAASAGRVVTDIDLTISRATKEVVSASINNVIVAATSPGGRHHRADRPVREIAAPSENRVWHGRRPTSRRTRQPVGESSLGDIIADAQLWATSGPPGRRPRRSRGRLVHERRGIRADINAGPITYGEAFTVQPFADVLMTMDMTGAEIEAVLEQQFTAPTGSSRSRRR